MGDLLLLVVRVEVPGRGGEGGVGPTTQHHTTFVLGHLGHERSGIVIFRSPKTSAEDLHARLVAAGIKCAPRGGGVRFSPHFYNDLADADAALDVVSS